MTLTPALRAAIVASARAHADTWYVWGGNGWDGADCSGWVQLCLHEAGVHPWASRFPYRLDMTAARMWAECAQVDKPQAGDLAFYGPRGGAPNHVVLVTEVDGAGVIQEVIGSSKGDSTCTSVEIAKARNARVQVRRWPMSHRYRKDFMGFRRPVVR